MPIVKLLLSSMSYLSESMRQDFVVALRRVDRALEVYSRQLEQGFGLTRPQVLILDLVRLAPSTIGTLARSAHFSQATVTDVVERLENRGFVSRSRSDGDRRRVVVSLTESGRLAVSTLPSPLPPVGEQALALLPDWERNQLLAGLQRLAVLLETPKVATA